MSLDKLQNTLDAEQFAHAAALILLFTPGSVVDGVGARTEAVRLLSSQLKDKTIARKLIDQQVEVVIVPRNVKMTDLPQFASLQGQTTFDGRTWDPVRGSGGMKVGNKIYTAITEENLMGTDVDTSVVPSGACYAPGYSTTTHEFAHTIHLFALDQADKTTITNGYNAKKAAEATNPDVEWVDGPNFKTVAQDQGDRNAAYTAHEQTIANLQGDAYTKWIAQLILNNALHTEKPITQNQLIADQPTYAQEITTKWAAARNLLTSNGILVNKEIRHAGKTVTRLDNNGKAKTGGAQQCYAAMNELEYFAQLANAFLGANAGVDPYTRQPRHNGSAWVENNEPASIKDLLAKTMKKDAATNTNPRP
jgi:hypothetical protein